MTNEELKKYFAKDLGWGWTYQSQKVFAFLQEAAKHAKGGAILDAGAGHQRYKPFFEECLYLAQEHPVAGQQNKGIQQFDILCDVRTIPLQNDVLEAVLSTSSLEHMEFPLEFFHEAFRVLKPGGGLFINVPFIYGEHEQPYDFQRLTRFGLRRWYEAAGFERVEIEPMSNSMNSALFMLSCALNEEMAARHPARGLSPRRVAQAIERRVVRVMCALLNRRWGETPHEATTAPIGWIARGFKARISGRDFGNTGGTVAQFLAHYGSAPK